MPLESGTYISDLNAANPLGSDPIAFVDDHIRLIKGAVKATFPNVTGAVTKTHTAINNIPDNTTSSIANLQTQINTITGTANGLAVVPVGGIIIWSGASTAVPTGWFLCNGSNGTPDLRNRFVIGAGSTYSVGGTGGSKDAVVVSHTHSATVTDPGHIHDTTIDTFGAGGSDNSNYGSASGAAVNTASATTGITVAIATAGVDGTDKNLPPYYALCYIMKG